LHFRTIWRPSKKDDGGLHLPAHCQNAREIGVRGDQHPILHSCAVEDHVVRCRLQTVLANVNGIVTARCSPLATNGDKALSTRNFKMGG
jgi:hypothetical protein